MGTETTVRDRRNCSPCPPEVLARFRQMLENQRADLLHSCQGLSHVALRKSGDQGGDDSMVTEDTADLASEIDLEKAQDARREAERALEGASTDATDLAAARAQLQAALLRIRVAERRHREGPRHRG